MKTVLPNEIKTVEEAKAFLTALHENGESYHPEDNAHGIAWGSIPSDQIPTKEECDKLNKLMRDIYNLPGNEKGPNLAFDPCGFFLDLMYPPPKIEIDNSETLIKEVRTDNTGRNVYNDVVVLKNGWIIRIGSDGLSVFKNEEDDENGIDAAKAEFFE